MNAQKEKLYLSKTVYKVTVRYKDGGWFSGDEFKSECLDEAKRVGLKNYTRCGACNGGYLKIEKIQYINGLKSLPIKELLEFVGSEKEFLLNNKVTIEEYKKELVDDNRFSYRVAPSFIEIERKHTKNKF
jgi:hypothetical protein